MAWGSNSLVVEAKPPERAAEIAAQLASLGFQATDAAAAAAYAGLLTFTHSD